MSVNIHCVMMDEVDIWDKWENDSEGSRSQGKSRFLRTFATPNHAD
jgi:hypothetical protein